MDASTRTEHDGHGEGGGARHAGHGQLHASHALVEYIGLVVDYDPSDPNDPRPSQQVLLDQGGERVWATTASPSATTQQWIDHAVDLGPTGRRVKVESPPYGNPATRDWIFDVVRVSDA